MSVSRVSRDQISQEVDFGKLHFSSQDSGGQAVQSASYAVDKKLVTIQESTDSSVSGKNWIRTEYDFSPIIDKYGSGSGALVPTWLLDAAGWLPIGDTAATGIIGGAFTGIFYRKLNEAEAGWNDFYTKFTEDLNAKCPDGQPMYDADTRNLLFVMLNTANGEIHSNLQQARDIIRAFNDSLYMDIGASAAKTFYKERYSGKLAQKFNLTEASTPSMDDIVENAGALAADKLGYEDTPGFLKRILDMKSVDEANDATMAAMDFISSKESALSGQLAGKQNCEPTPTPEPSPDIQSPDVPVRAVHDPSGYVYEAVPSNRLEGVTAKILENSGGVWNAGEFDQANPLTTDADGTYHWDVPEGSWKVEFTKAGYTTTNTEEAAKARGYTDGWLEVPPAQLEVNVAMMSTTAPTVSNSVAYTNCVEVEFSQYMDIDSTKSAITVEPDLGTITVEPIDSEDNGSGTKYAKRFRITPAAGSVPTEGVKIKVGAEAKNYSGTALSSVYTSTVIKPEIRPTSLEASSTGILINRETTLPVTINPSIEGLDIQVENLAPGILSTTETTLKTDAAGKVFIIVTGNLPGVGRLRITEPKSGISRELEISISSSTRPEKITVTRQDGLGVTGSTTVPKGTVITLSTTTAGAAIRYTLNDTCPCTKEALYYTEPIIINSTTILRAAALIDGQYSETINYTLTVSGGSSSGGGYYPSPTYKVTLPENTAHGTVKANSAFGHNGDTITLTVTPDKGWTLDSLTVLDSAGNDLKLTAVSDNKYTFTMPAGDVKVSATFRKVNDPKPPVWKNPFPDVNDNKWYIEAIEFVCTNGLMAGYSNGKFGPDDIITRAQFAQIIYNKEGKPEGGSSVFTDVTTGWYAAAVNWAASKDIVAGIGGGKFAPGQSITRQDLATMLWRYAGSPEPKKNELNFSDAGQVSKYAWKALCWVTENGIVNGKGNGTLDPKGKATRAEAAQMLMNYIKKQPKIRK